MEEIIYERQDAVEIVTLNRPERLNAFTFAMIRELADHFQGLALDSDVRAILVTGAGKAFCSGADLGEVGERSGGITPVEMRAATQWYSRMIAAMWSLEKPIIGAVNGVAAGAACNFALSCDLLIAAEDARFIQIFVRRGLVADAGGTYFLPRLIGLARAKELIFTGEPLGAQRAWELGIVSRVVPRERLMEEALEMAHRLAQGPTKAIGMCKRMLNRSFESDLLTALEMESSLQGIAASTEDMVEGVLSFLEKREPRFEGR
jgi:2-(1,2-epoxy-1,2-dihydrophenyl)acetyl-CoA isomerase